MAHPTKETPLTTAINAIANDNIRVTAIGFIKDGTPKRRLKIIKKQLFQIALGVRENVFTASFTDWNNVPDDVAQQVHTCP